MATWTTIRIRTSTREKLRKLKRSRRWPIHQSVDLLADRELAVLRSEKENIATPPGRSGDNGVSSPPQHAPPGTAGDLQSPGEAGPV